MYSIFKRGADILISIIALPFMLLLTIVLGILIYLEDEGPIFYKSARVGRGVWGIERSVFFNGREK